MNQQPFRRHPFFIKLFNWEYWSFNMVYVWIYPVWIFLCLRARSFFFFAAANPSIKNGGFLNESKKEIGSIMPFSFCPPTIYFSVPADKESVKRHLLEKGFGFPLIGKPNIGGRGRGIKILNNTADVEAYVDHALVDFHIQQFIAYKQETGIFYYRYPGQPTGKLSGIVKKEFLSVTGDGVHTIRQHLLKDERAVLQMESLENMHREMLNDVLPYGEEKIMVPYGNHARGAKFLDDSDRIDEQLTQTIDAICRQVSNFYYGRLDIRYNNWEELKQGRNFSVIEVNGAGSEPTHMYDPRHSLFFAWKEIIRHWIILWRISRMNHKNGHPYLSIKEGIRMFREDKANSVKLAGMPE